MSVLIGIVLAVFSLCGAYNMALADDPKGMVCLGENLAKPLSEHSSRLYLTIDDSSNIYFESPYVGPRVVARDLETDKDHMVKVYFDNKIVQSWKVNFSALKTDSVLIWRATGSWRMEPTEASSCSVQPAALRQNLAKLSDHHKKETKMQMNQNEIERREKAAISAIKSAFGTEEDEYGATLFVTHHLQEIESAYWQKHLGSAHPEPSHVLDILVLRSHWGDEDDNGMDTFDFTLPDSVTDYVISVRFDESGQVEEITMEN